MQVARSCTESASFEKMSGRRPGQEDATSHLRKGVVGDWREHFDDEISFRFESIAGYLLTELGYLEPTAAGKAA